jgi:hypothetical protein
MNIKKECNKRVAAYNLGCMDALNGNPNIKGTLVKPLRKAYQNGFTEGQRANQARKSRSVRDDGWNYY